jgi:hypothetical protein
VLKNEKLKLSQASAVWVGGFALASAAGAVVLAAAVSIGDRDVEMADARREAVASGNAPKAAAKLAPAIPTQIRIVRKAPERAGAHSTTELARCGRPRRGSAKRWLRTLIAIFFRILLTSAPNFAPARLQRGSGGRSAGYALGR